MQKYTPITTFIYALVDPRESGHIRYIGKTNKPKRRLCHHCLQSKAKIIGRTHRDNWIRKLLMENARPIMLILEETPIDKWEEREKYHIALAKENGHKLVNADQGGVGGLAYWNLEKKQEVSKRMQGKRPRFFTAPRAAGWKHTEGTKEEMRKIKVNGPRYWKSGPTHPCYGKKHSEESRKKMSEAHVRYYSDPKNHKPMSEESKKKISIANSNRKHPFWVRKKVSEALKGEKCYWYGKKLDAAHRQKLVECRRGHQHEFIAYRQETMEEVWRGFNQRQCGRELGITTLSNISKVLSGHHPSCGGYVFRFVSSIGVTNAQ